MKVVLPDNSIKKLTGAPGPERSTRSGSSSFLQVLETCAMASDQKGNVAGALPLDKEKLHFIAEMMRLQMQRHLIGSILMGPGEGEWQDRMSNIQPFPAVTGRDSGEKKKAAETASAETGPLAAAPANLEGVIRRASETYGVEPGLIRAVIKTESGFNPNAVSPKGARGLMQLMPATARDLGVRDAFNPEENVMAGTRYLKGLLDRYNGDLNLALGAYNWGMGNIERNPDRLPKETLNYIGRVTKYYQG